MAENGIDEEQLNDSVHESISHLLGMVGTAGVIMSYLLVYVFRLGESMRYEFDPSLITVSINDFLNVLIPILLCIIYAILVSLLVRDLAKSSKKAWKGKNRVLNVVKSSLGIAACVVPLVLICAPIQGRIGTMIASVVSIAECVLSIVIPMRTDDASGSSGSNDFPVCKAAHPKQLHLVPSHFRVAFIATSFIISPIMLALSLTMLQPSTWIAFVTSIAICTAVISMCVSVSWKLSPIEWVKYVLIRSDNKVSDSNANVVRIVIASIAIVFVLALSAGYTGVLDMTGSNGFILINRDTHDAVAVLALFDGNRAVMRDAKPDGHGSYIIDMSEPYTSGYLTDGYDIIKTNDVIFE